VVQQATLGAIISYLKKILKNKMKIQACSQAGKEAIN
jgi:hypothetical protein